MMKRLYHLSIEKMPYWLGLVSTLVFAFFIAVVLPSQSALAIENGLLESIDTSWFYNARQLYEIAQSYGENGRSFYITQRWTFDLVWPLVYFSFIFSLSTLLYKSIGLSKMNTWLLVFSWFSVGFDYLENIMVSIVMFRYPAQTWIIADLAGTVTSLKWIFLTLSFIVLFLLIILKVVQWVIWNRRKTDAK
jgi:hypothetical protein